jgi:hypothetical protein
MDCKVKWTGDGMSFIAETGTNHTVVMDGAIEAGGRNLAPRPMELMLAGAGGCAAFDVVLILKKGRHAVKGRRGQPAGRACGCRAAGVYPHSFPLSRDREAAQVRSGGARHRVVEGQILFGHQHARKDCRNNARFRNHRRLRRAFRTAQGRFPGVRKSPSAAASALAAVTGGDSPDHESHDRPRPLAVRIPACTPESFAGRGACSLNCPPHPPALLQQPENGGS